MQASAWWPTSENTLDLVLGRYVGATGSDTYRVPDENKRWSYSTLPRGWTEEDITLEGWSHTDHSMRVGSGMTSWIPKLNRGYMFGGVYVFYQNTSANGQETYEVDGLVIYNPETKIMTNTSTPVGPIGEGGLVHLTTATDEVLIQFGGRTGVATKVVCSLGRPVSRFALFLPSGL